jgi:hypothetical protein
MIHPEWQSVKHLKAVNEKRDQWRTAYRTWLEADCSPESVRQLKRAEWELNLAVETAIAGI